MDQPTQEATNAGDDPLAFTDAEQVVINEMMDAIRHGDVGVVKASINNAPVYVMGHPNQEGFLPLAVLIHDEATMGLLQRPTWAEETKEIDGG